MNKIVYFLITLTLLTLSILTFDSRFRDIAAQNRGENTQELVEQDKPQNAQESQQLETQPQQEQNIEQIQQQEERKLEHNLNIQQRGTQSRESPGNTEAFDDAVPISPDQEMPLKF
ncbi:hypothetical protein [Chroococcus sp. FPU101]|uniref:hypothetical protein n=1 Tax=Chroococcus sp. FPU101 TaxID=1974212 RepID=UPI001A9020E1|nr:hypothetical protein [Chroococcus sp. FPU101]